jgi:RNA polymerase sigma-70 factor (sigma-E family)
VTPILRDAGRGETLPPGPGAPPVGREVAVPLLFRAHGEGLIRLGYCLTGDRGAAEEVVQDAFVSLYRNWDGLRDRSVALPYLRVAVVNQCRSVHRRRARTIRATAPLTPEIASVPGADGDAIAHDEAVRLAAVVRELPQRQREVVVCRYYLDLTERQTADLLEVSVGAVKKHASRALAKLHDQLEVASWTT